MRRRGRPETLCTATTCHLILMKTAEADAHGTRPNVSAETEAGEGEVLEFALDMT